MAFFVLYVPCPDEATALYISETLVSERFAACANVFPIQSIYWWDSMVKQDGEWVAILKSRLSLGGQLERKIEAMHPYEVPCIMRFESQANEAYERWIEESTSVVP